MKEQKGITLIALIITIVVLLIIAVVTIGAIQESGIIGHSQKTASDYKIAQEKELIGIGYSEYIIEKNTTQNAQLKVKGAQVTPIENIGWEVVFSGTNSKYQVDKSGTIIYIEDDEDTGEGEDENDEEIIIAAEKDLMTTIYWYNTMYNPKQPQIVSASGYYDDGEDEYPRMCDRNKSLGAYIKDTYFNIEKDFFGQTISEPGDIQGNIAAKITHFDGTEEEITLVTTDNEKWIYESEGSSLMGIDKTYIGFRPFAKYSDYVHVQDKIEQYEESSEYHYMVIDGGTAVPFYKLEMLGEKTIEFSYNCQAMVGVLDIETGKVIESMYSDINNVNKITVNFLEVDSNKAYTKVYTKEKIFDGARYLGDDFFYSSPEVPILYVDGMFYINMPEASLKTQITSVIVEENGVATKYNVTNSTMVAHAPAAN